jgi:hypothetical protein
MPCQIKLSIQKHTFWENSDHRLATLTNYNKIELTNGHDTLADSTALK